MLSTLCKELNNWFDTERFFGEFTIEDNVITGNFDLQENQYFRIAGSVFNDGVYQYTPSLELTDETFNGAIWAMAVPKSVVALSNEIDAWADKYANAVSTPYQSESFGGYSYSKASSGSGSGNITWQDVFANRLNLYRKIRP